MYIEHPANTLKIAAGSEGRGPEGTHYLLEMRQDTAKFYMANIDAIPSKKNYAATRDFLSEISGLEFTPEQTEALLDLYPRARIKVAVCNGVGDTDVRDDLSDAVALLILGCTWPTYGEQADVDEFLGMLQAQAVEMGFTNAAEQA